MDKRTDKRPVRYQNNQQNKNRVKPLGTLGDIPRQQKREKSPQKSDSKTLCAYCGGHLRACGAVGHAGHLRWKCRKCGRTLWTRPEHKPPVPLVPVSKPLGGHHVQMRKMRERVDIRKEMQEECSSKTE